MKEIGDIVKFKCSTFSHLDENEIPVVKEFFVIEEIYAVKQIDEKIIYITKTGSEHSHDNVVEE
tara:strand:- start:210 stop:401 length:192 start_codon:yes stop_codon:yes gene_type:complete